MTACQTTPGISDHNAVVADISTQVKLVKKPPREIFLYHKANWDLIRERMLDIYERYFELNSTTQRSVNENWEYIYEKCSQLIQEMVPKKTIGSKFHLPWMNAALKRLIKKKQRTYNRAKKYQRTEDWDEYKRLQHQTKCMRLPLFHGTARNGMAYSVALFSGTEQSRHTCPPAHQL